MFVSRLAPGGGLEKLAFLLDVFFLCLHSRWLSKWCFFRLGEPSGLKVGFFLIRSALDGQTYFFFGGANLSSSNLLLFYCAGHFFEEERIFPGRQKIFLKAKKLCKRFF